MKSSFRFNKPVQPGQSTTVKKLVTKWLMLANDGVTTEVSTVPRYKLHVKLRKCKNELATMKTDRSFAF
jgi:hypothetical protein